VEQRLGRDASHVQADTAEALVALDQDDLQAEVGGAERGRVAARAGAEHDDLGVVVGRALDRRRGHRRQALLVGRAAVRTGAGAGPGDREDQRALGDGVANLQRDVADGARDRRRDVHRRLVGLERDQRVLLGDGVTGVDHHLDDRHVGEVADVGDVDLDGLVLARLRAVARGGVGRRLGRRVLGDGRLGGLGGRAIAAGVASGAVERKQHGALGHGVADRDLELADRARGRRRDVHRRLVRLERDERVLLGDGVAGRDEDLDDRYVGEVADVGDAHLERVSHGGSPPRAARAAGR
jgi:hypothetical protein